MKYTSLIQYTRIAMVRLLNPVRFTVLFASLLLVLIWHADSLANWHPEPPNVDLLEGPFHANTGQIRDSAVQFYHRLPNGMFFVNQEGGLVYSFVNKGQVQNYGGWVIREEFSGRLKPEIKGLGPKKTTRNAVSINNSEPENSNILTFDNVVLEGIYPGINVELHKAELSSLSAQTKLMPLRYKNSNIEKIFRLSPNADWREIKINVQGATGLDINEQGELVVDTGLGQVVFTAPIAYQEVAGGRQPVTAAYVVAGLEYGFKIGTYDPSSELIIDPLLASSFVAEVVDPKASYSRAIIKENEKGQVYIAGSTSSPDLPSTPGAFHDSFNGGLEDVFIAKLDHNLTKLLALTFLGGKGSDRVYDIAFDKSGNLLLAGETSSPDFPVTKGAYDQSYNGGRFDAFVASIDPDLKTIIAASFIGGEGQDRATSISVKADNTVYLGGFTESPTFPTTDKAYNRKIKGRGDIFITSLDSSFKKIYASTLLGGSEMDNVNDLSIAPDGNVYLTGFTFSADFPVTSGNFATSLTGESDIFVAKFTSDLQTLSASSFLGGQKSDIGTAIDINQDGTVYVVGMTGSSDFPIVGDSYDDSFNGGANDIVVAQLTNDLVILLASTFIGGSEDDQPYALVLDKENNVYIAGESFSPNFPVTKKAYDKTYNGGDGDLVICKMSSRLNSLKASTYIGGGSADYIPSLFKSQDSSLLIGAHSFSQDFPTIAGGFLLNNPGNGAAIVIIKIDKELSLQ